MIHLNMSGYLIDGLGCCSQCHNCNSHYHEKGDKETLICWGLFNCVHGNFQTYTKIETRIINPQVPIIQLNLVNMLIFHLFSGRVFFAGAC